MRFDVLTLFPEIFSGYMTQSLLKLAIDRSLVQIHLHNIRDWSCDKHKCVDDRPFGGGPGMVIKPEPTVAAVEAVQAMGSGYPSTGQPNTELADTQQSNTRLTDSQERGHLILLTPQGRRLDQPGVEKLALHDRLVLLCGRYEGFDQRVSDILKPDEISVGDFVLNGGEVAAMVLVDTVIRLVPGVLGDEDSSRLDSFSEGARLLEHAQYTRPREFRGLGVPEVLLSGNHDQIADWRKKNSIERTQSRRPELLADPLDRSHGP
ncbi:MAG: tRNA (guanosine(37)-N1)-methyltransferase TrmD [Pirellulales bacterium]|nr:tRNA (guanosine(37)-N1)-methyltransferase TrmD [Pirellulales bacterium]